MAFVELRAFNWMPIVNQDNDQPQHLSFGACNSTMVSSLCGWWNHPTSRFEQRKKTRWCVPYLVGSLMMKHWNYYGWCLWRQRWRLSKNSLGQPVLLTINKRSIKPFLSHFRNYQPSFKHRHASFKHPLIISRGIYWQPNKHHLAFI